MKHRYFKLYWMSGKTEVVHAQDTRDRYQDFTAALSLAGICLLALQKLSRWEELPAEFAAQADEIVVKIA